MCKSGYSGPDSTTDGTSVVVWSSDGQICVLATLGHDGDSGGDSGDHDCQTLRSEAVVTTTGQQKLRVGFVVSMGN